MANPPLRWVWLEGWFIFLFRHGDVKGGDSVAALSIFFVPFSKQHGRDRKKMRWILAQVSSSSYSHTQAEDEPSKLDFQYLMSFVEAAPTS